jgi:hypothetical protein
VRKLWYAGAAVASGFLLFAASPARADVQPTGAAAPSPSDLLPGNAIAPPFGDLLSGAGGWAVAQGRATLSGAATRAMSGAGDAMRGANTAAGQADNGLDRVRRPTNNLHLTVPLDGSRPLTHLQPGTNSPRLSPQRSTEGLPSADVIGPLDPGNSLAGTSLAGTGDGGGLIGGNVLDQLPLLSAVMPDGQQQSFDSLDRPTAGETESTTGGLPLLGGLGGALPVDGLPSVPGGNGPDLTGLPGGGLAVLAPATDSAAAPAADHTAATPTAAPPKHKNKVKPTASASASAGPADPRLHEEPIDGEAAPRTFSPDGRPVAGVDQQYK